MLFVILHERALKPEFYGVHIHSNTELIVRFDLDTALSDFLKLVMNFCSSCLAAVYRL
jgi:hypothetical protein